MNEAQNPMRERLSIADVKIRPAFAFFSFSDEDLRNGTRCDSHEGNQKSFDNDRNQKYTGAEIEFQDVTGFQWEMDAMGWNAKESDPGPGVMMCGHAGCLQRKAQEPNTINRSNDVLVLKQGMAGRE